MTSELRFPIFFIPIIIFLQLLFFINERYDMKNVLEELWAGFLADGEFQFIVCVLGTALLFFFAFFL